MKPEHLLLLAILAVVALCFAGSFAPSCSFRPALINIDRKPRTEPILPWRRDKKDEVAK